MAKPTADEACRLVVRHEVGGDYRADLLKDADSISYFEVNLPFYHEREGWEETKRRSIWGYRRLSVRGREIAKSMTYDDEALTRLLKRRFEKLAAKPCPRGFKHVNRQAAGP